MPGPALILAFSVATANEFRAEPGTPPCVCVCVSVCESVCVFVCVGAARIINSGGAPKRVRMGGRRVCVYCHWPI